MDTIKRQDAVKAVQDNLAFSVKSTIIAALNALPAADEWQPIETAPDEQVPLILWAKREGDPTFRQVCGWRYGRQWSIYGCAKSQTCLDVIQPTHWKPIGKPPQCP